MKGFFGSRRFKQGSMATAITAVVVALVVVLNIVATTLTERYSLALDLTPQKLFSITDQTRQYLGALDKDVVIYVLNREESFKNTSEYHLQALEVLKKYALESSRITIEYIDFNANPSFGQRYPDLQLSTSTILITSGNKARDVTPYDLYDIVSDPYGYTQTQVLASKSEQVLTSAVLAVISEKSYNVAVITGHNEVDISLLASTLRSNNYFTETVDIVTSEIDSAYDIAIVAGSERDFEEDELRRLDRFLENGGKYGKTLLYFASSKSTDLPGLDAFLADWGVKVNEGIVYETDANRMVPQTPTIAILNFAETVYSKNVSVTGKTPITANARPLELLFSSKGSVMTSELLRFSGTAGIIISETEGVEPNGIPIPYATISRFEGYEGAKRIYSQVIVFGSTAFLDAVFMQNANFANSDYLLDMLTELTGREESVNIQTKDLTSQMLTITGGQALAIGVSLVLVLPLAVLISGLVIWGRRRHR